MPDRVHHRVGTAPYEIVAIAASAGGLLALTAVPGGLPRDFAAAMPSSSTSTLTTAA